MTIKIRAFENNRELIIPISDITGSVNRGREIFDIPIDITNGNEIVLGFPPLVNSDNIYLNGLMMTEGNDYDYNIVGNTITFNSGVLTSSGHILVNYSY